jgi:hypothetical protein
VFSNPSVHASDKQGKKECRRGRQQDERQAGMRRAKSSDEKESNGQQDDFKRVG